jgi:hypothetical protein
MPGTQPLRDASARALRTILAATAVSAALTACAGGGPAAPASTPGGPASASASAPFTAAGFAPTGPQVDVLTALVTYDKALVAKDYPAACRLMSLEAVASILAALKAQNLSATTCEEGFTAVFGSPEAGPGDDELVTSLQVSSIAITGDTATVAWSANKQGQRTSTTSRLRRVDGGWKLLPVDS